MIKALRSASLLAMILPLAIGTARAGETTTYTYDAQGRLVAVQSSGTVNNGQNVSVSYDAAGNRTNYTVAGAGPGTPTLSIGNASVTEGGNLLFTVTLSPSATGTVTVNYATANGTAVAPGDYTAASGTLTFTGGQTSKTITVATIDDSTTESSEVMTVTLSGATGGAAIDPAAGTGTIGDNDSVSPANLAIGNAAVTEGGTLSFTVTRAGNTVIAASASYATSSGTATSGSDFTAASGAVSFAASETTKTISVATTDDTAVESAETMTLTLSSPGSNTTITTATGTGTINDNDVGWNSSLTAGTWSYYCGSTCTAYGYAQYLMGSLSNTTFGTDTITNLYSTSGTIVFAMSNSTAPANSGWTSITVPGAGTFNRSSATYYVNGTSASWFWTSSATVTSGTIVIQ